MSSSVCGVCVLESSRFWIIIIMMPMQPRCLDSGYNPSTIANTLPFVPQNIMCNREIEIIACGAIVSGAALKARNTTSLINALHHKLLPSRRKMQDLVCLLKHSTATKHFLK